MSNKIILIALLLAYCLSNNLQAQDKKKQNRGILSGDLQLNTKLYEPDSARNAIGNPFYETQFYGADAWLQLNYRVGGFDMGLRFDMFQNTAIFNPTVPFSDQGIGRWYISKKIKKLTITAGYFYEQYGSGITLRAYEARPLGIDQALFGVNLRYDLNDDWTIKAFTARQKNRFDFYRPILKGFNVDGYAKLGPEEGKQITLQPGISFVNRTIDSETMDAIAAELNSIVYPVAERFLPKYNVFVGSIYNHLQAGNIGWRVELAAKSEDVVRNASGRLINPSSGYVIYNSLTYSKRGFGLVLQSKYTKNFDFRVSPNELLIRGVVDYLPALTRQNTYRLLSRYNAATQPLGELIFTADLTFRPKKGLFVTAHFSNMNDLDGNNLFREIYADIEIKQRKKPWKIITGIQTIDYNQQIFEQKGDFVHTLTPFIEYNYKFTRKKSMRLEAQYMLTKRNYRLFGSEDPNPDKSQDLGDWAWLLAEFNIAPHWSFSAGSMYNFDQELLYPALLVVLTQKATRFSLGYGKQPEGVICTGGICRFEPAFSGVQFTLTTNF